MKHDKVLHIRVPAELHDYLTRYAAANFTSVSSVVLQAVAKAVGYKPKMATPRTYTYEPTSMAESQEDREEREWREEMTRRAANAKPVKLTPDPIVGGEWMDVDE